MPKKIAFYIFYYPKKINGVVNFAISKAKYFVDQSDMDVKKSSLNSLELSVKFVNLVGTNVLDKYQDY